MIANYYFWKWADNDLPGKPAEVHAALLRGEKPRALQSFDARPLLKCLGLFAAEGRKRGEEWEWQTQPANSPKQTLFVFATCPAVNASGDRVRRFAAKILPLDLSGYDEPGGHLIPCLPPKLNCFIPGQFPQEAVHDIKADELPVLLRRICPGQPEPWAELWNRKNDAIVAIAEGRRYRVEWAERYQSNPPVHSAKWRARDAKRLAALGGKDDTKALPPAIDPDFLTFADTLSIFQAFLRGVARPTQYCWRKLKRT